MYFGRHNFLSNSFRDVGTRVFHVDDRQSASAGAGPSPLVSEKFSGLSAAAKRGVPKNSAMNLEDFERKRGIKIRLLMDLTTSAG